LLFAPASFSVACSCYIVWLTWPVTHRSVDVSAVQPTYGNDAINPCKNRLTSGVIGQLTCDLVWTLNRRGVGSGAGDRNCSQASRPCVLGWRDQSAQVHGQAHRAAERGASSSSGLERKRGPHCVESKLPIIRKLLNSHGHAYIRIRPFIVQGNKAEFIKTISLVSPHSKIIAHKFISGRPSWATFSQGPLLVFGPTLGGTLLYRSFTSI